MLPPQIGHAGELPPRVSIGLAGILPAAATYGGWEWWMATRTWVPLDMPISLAQGHIRSSGFTINLDAGFGIFNGLMRRRRSFGENRNGVRMVIVSSIHSPRKARPPNEGDPG